MMTTDTARDRDVPIPNVHPAHDPELKLLFFQCAVGYLERAVALLQAEAQRQQQEDGQKEHRHG